MSNTLKELAIVYAEEDSHLSVIKRRRRILFDDFATSVCPCRSNRECWPVTGACACAFKALPTIKNIRRAIVQLTPKQKQHLLKTIVPLRESEVAWLRKFLLRPKTDWQEFFRKHGDRVKARAIGEPVPGRHKITLKAVANEIKSLHL